MWDSLALGDLAQEEAPNAKNIFIYSAYSHMQGPGCPNAMQGSSDH